MKTKGIETWQGCRQIRTEYSLTFQKENITLMMVQKMFWVSQVTLGPLAAFFSVSQNLYNSFRTQNQLTGTPATAAAAGRAASFRQLEAVVTEAVAVLRRLLRSSAKVMTDTDNSRCAQQLDDLQKSVPKGVQSGDQQHRFRCPEI
jgi:hypothetical protein